MNRLFLVRHGITEWNHDERYQGQLDIPLSTKGRLQITRLRDRLRDEKFTRCYTSALARARLSAEIILEEHFCPLQETADLNELSYGQWEGLTRVEIIERFPENWARYRQDPAQHAPEGGETRQHLQQRVQRFLGYLAREHEDATLLVVAHGGTVRAIVAHYLDVSPYDVRRLRIDNASLSIVDIYGEEDTLSLFNDTAHLGAHKPALDREPAH